MKGMTAHNVKREHSDDDVIKVYTGRTLTRLNDQNRPEQYPESILMLYKQAKQEYGDKELMRCEDGTYSQKKHLKGGEKPWQL